MKTKRLNVLIIFCNNRPVSVKKLSLCAKDVATGKLMECPK